MRIALSCIGMILGIFLLAAIPLTINISTGSLVWQLDGAWQAMTNYVIGIVNGDSFLFQEGTNRFQDFLKVVPRHFLLSLGYIVLSGLTAVILGMLVSTWYSRSKQEWVKDIIGFLGMIPDFILVLFLQIAVVSVYQSTGWKVARVASKGVHDHAILLPLITLAIIPTIYLIRTLSERAYDVMGEDYILTAKAKGLTKWYIYIQHVVRNVLPFLKADLHKVASIMISNLFIVEYLYNVNGLTKLLFASTGYQFNLTVNALLAFIGLYIVMYAVLRLFIGCLERIFAYD
ncbi:ABC transporter permease subunit [Ornithinibacillus gellani]|uniref:ABC transporter permease subunit n=1 Tax=Ornithinibacillus gellani TaxID=2293253 RepID=UPI001680FA81|nr:ABC transporter permease subunit [Ornithinibacillus gellani]